METSAEDSTAIDATAVDDDEPFDDGYSDDDDDAGDAGRHGAGYNGAPGSDSDDPDGADVASDFRPLGGWQAKAGSGVGPDRVATVSSVASDPATAGSTVLSGRA